MVVVVRLPSGLENGLNSYVLPLTILLLKGERLALALIYLGSLSAHLDKCVANIAQPLGHYDVIMPVNFSFLQIFLWLCFGALVPKPIEYCAMVPSKARVMASPRGVKSIYRVALRWIQVKQQALGKVVG